MKSAFFKHNMENEREVQSITRSSGVYYFARRDDFRTQLHYMNYWREKRGSTVVQVLKIRDMQGHLTYEATSTVDFVGARVIELNDVLDAVGLRLTKGSVELQFLSEANIAVAYPAVVVRYLGRSWHTVTHTSQRYFSDTSGDDDFRISELTLAEEGNLTIHADLRLEPFVIIHNGLLPVKPAPIEVTVYGETGASATIQTSPMAWAPCQTRVLYLKDLINYRATTGAGKGTFSLRFPLGGIFPRLIGGNSLNGEWSVDHTNFASLTGPGALDVIPVSGDSSFKELVFNIPTNPAPGWRCFADIYPTYPDRNYEIETAYVGGDGAKKWQESIHVGAGGVRSVLRIPVDSATKPGNFEMVYHHAKELPRRFHTGIHYQFEDGNPGFLTDGPLPHSTPPIRTRWFPVFEVSENENFLLIANRTIGSETPAPLVYSARLFNSFGDEPLTAALNLGAYESRCLYITDLFSDAEAYLKGLPGWCYLVADRPQRSVLHYASRRGKSIAVDHAF